DELINRGLTVAKGGNAPVTSRPARTVVTYLRPVPESTPLARGVVRQLLDGELEPEALDTAELCVSELVTNAILHASTDVELSVTLARQRVRLAVRDQSSDLPTLERHTRTASTGRGLAMVIAIADAWGVERHDHRGKTVWCELVEGRAHAAFPDIQDVLDTWELTHQDLGGPLEPEHGSTIVSLLGYPVKLGLALQEHYDAVVRECQLLAAPRRSGAQQLPENLVELATALAERYPTELAHFARPDPRRVAAEARGEETVDLEYSWSEDAVPLMKWWQGLFDEVDAHARAGDLLVPGISDELARLRGWALTEFSEQPRGAPPRPWTEAD
ncbi:MAG TPA: ATP-binding protein, partial [Actinomycetales bacterium]|nr:ATP-binding protein [Actinomycetales bacterium]